MNILQLNRNYYALYEELYKAQRFLTEKQFDIMAASLYKQYMEELDVCLTERILEVGEQTFELKFRSRMYVPRRGFFGYNRIAKHLLKKYKLEFLTELKKLELDVKDEKQLHEQMDAKLNKPAASETTALTVPSEQQVAPAKEPKHETNG